MDSNWRAGQSASGGVGDSSMESGDWRAQLQADSRQRIVNKMCVYIYTSFSYIYIFYVPYIVVILSLIHVMIT